MAELTEVKDRLDAEVDRWADTLIDASHQIHANPELAFEERFAHDLLTGILDDAGIPVERGAYGLGTAFEAKAGSEGPTIAVLCEYDALPVIGHACGHNIIGTAGLGAGIAAASLAEELGGRVVIMGTPGEEGGGGKVLMADEGAFEGVDAAMMVHPAGGDLRAMNAIAIQQCHVTYEGKAAHAAAAPERGRNALDAAVLGYMNIAALRQHIGQAERIHGIFTEAGDAANVVPDRTKAVWYVRSPKLRGLEPLKERVLACLEAGAVAAGCTASYEWMEPVYADLVDVDPFIDLYVANIERFGRTVYDHKMFPQLVGSTDMGNVSYLVPSIHPIIGVSPPTVAIHTKDFVRYAGGPDGDKAVVEGAKAMAATIADLWLQPGKLDEIKAAFQAAL
jgi:amidohydrolase